MIKQTILVKKEQQLLEEHYKKSKTRLIRERAHAVLLHTDGYHAPQISSILRTDEKTIRTWIHDFELTRIASIFPKYEGNTNAAKLTKEQLQEIQETLDKPLSDEGSLSKAFWTTGTLKEYLFASYGVVYESDRSYHHIFELCDYSFKLPEKQNWRRDDQLVATRMLEVQAELKEKIEQGYLPFAADECSLCFETILRRAWVKKGEKTVVKAESNKTRQNYFGALNLNSKKQELIRLEWQDTQNTIEALRELTKRYPNKKLALVWDNAAWHRSKELRSLLGKGNEFEHIHLIWLPPYAPDENPQEHVWRIGKDSVANQRTRTFDELKTLFEESISNRTFNYQIG